MPAMKIATPAADLSVPGAIAGGDGLHRPRILIVRLTSLGDVIKALPVVDDIRCALPDVSIDWVVERPCDALIGLHPGIDRVIALELRRYRKERRFAAGLVAALRDVRELRAERYDLIIDLQGRMKSALVGAMAHGPMVGLACGPTSERYYDRLYRRAVSRADLAGFDAVRAYRELAARAIGHPVPARGASFGLRAPPTPVAAGTIPASPFAVLIHGSSGSEKCWPEERWITLGRALHERGIRSLLPWGCASEGARARRLAACITGAIVPARVLELVEWVQVLTAATLAVGVDTGLTHLAGACATPTIAIFRATSALHSGVTGSGPHRNLGGECLEVLTGDVMGAADALLAGRLPVPDPSRADSDLLVAQH